MLTKKYQDLTTEQVVKQVFILQEVYSFIYFLCLPKESNKEKAPEMTSTAFHCTRYTTLHPLRSKPYFAPFPDCHPASLVYDFESPEG